MIMNNQRLQNKKGLSQVIGTLLMVLLTIAAIATVWGVINSFVSTELEGTGACYDVYDKVSLNSLYTCYNITANQTYVSIEIKDIEVDSILVAVEYGGEASPFELTNKNVNIPNVFNYPLLTPSVKMPGRESGKTYIVNITGVPLGVTIAPKINGKQCDASSTISNVPTCL